jgi:hypothetical protein
MRVERGRRLVPEPWFPRKTSGVKYCLVTLHLEVRVRVQIMMEGMVLILRSLRQ